MNRILSKAYFKRMYYFEVEQNMRDGVKEPYDEIHTADGIVGYYIEMYGSDAFYTWLNNIEDIIDRTPTQDYITNMLRKIA